MNSEQQSVLSSLVLELRRGVIVLAVLSQLEKPMYGYNLVTQLSQAGLAVEANTLYPLLRRLEGQGILQSNWETDGTKPRKYYSITPGGKEIYAALKQHWLDTNVTLNKLMGE